VSFKVSVAVLAGIMLAKNKNAVTNAKIAFLLLFNLDNPYLSSTIVPPPILF